MESTIEISKVTGHEAEFVVGCEFKNKLHAEQVFNQADNEYQVEPLHGVGDYLVDLYHGYDLISTFVTDEAGAKQIDKRFLGGMTG